MNTTELQSSSNELNQSNPSVINEQSLPFSNTSSNAGKKAVHVKWAGKTIALGTFPAAEADEKCARAKALTRVWRLTVRPKPSREWVMLELEKLQVRVVSGRLCHKGSGDDDDDDNSNKDDKSSKKGALLQPNASHNDSRLSHRDSITASLLSAVDMARGSGNRSDSLEWAHDSEFRMQRRSSSLSTTLLRADDEKDTRGASDVGKRISNHQKQNDSVSPDPAVPPRRPFVGGGSAAAYEAARADYYRLEEQKKANPKQHSLIGESIGQSIFDDARRLSGFRQSLGGMCPSGLSGGAGSTGLLGSSNPMGGGTMTPFGLTANSSQHYEMLKLHHMNLLNEIQETTLMMNLYQQQHLQQQQQQQHFSSSDHQNGSSTAEQQLAMQLAQQQHSLSASASLGLDSLYGGGGSNSQLSSLNQNQFNNQGNFNPIHAIMRPHNFLQNGGAGTGMGGGIGGGMGGGTGDRANGLGSDSLSELQRHLNAQQSFNQNQNQNQVTPEDLEEARQLKLKKIREEIAERQRLMDELEKGTSTHRPTSGGSKRKVGGPSPSLGPTQNKRVKKNTT